MYGEDTTGPGAATNGAECTTGVATAWLTVCELYEDAYGATTAAGITPAWTADRAKMAKIWNWKIRYIFFFTIMH